LLPGDTRGEGRGVRVTGCLAGGFKGGQKLGGPMLHPFSFLGSKVQFWLRRARWCGVFWRSTIGGLGKAGRIKLSSLGLLGDHPMVLDGAPPGRWCGGPLVLPETSASVHASTAGNLVQHRHGAHFHVIRGGGWGQTPGAKRFGCQIKQLELVGCGGGILSGLRGGADVNGGDGKGGGNPELVSVLVGAPPKRRARGDCLRLTRWGFWGAGSGPARGGTGPQWGKASPTGLGGIARHQTSHV